MQILADTVTFTHITIAEFNELWTTFLGNCKYTCKASQNTQLMRLNADLLEYIIYVLIFIHFIILSATKTVFI